MLAAIKEGTPSYNEALPSFTHRFQKFQVNIVVILHVGTCADYIYMFELRTKVAEIALL